MFHVGLCLSGSWFRFYRQMYMYIYYSSDFRESWGSSSIHPENLDSIPSVCCHVIITRVVDCLLPTGYIIFYRYLLSSSTVHGGTAAVQQRRCEGERPRHPETITGPLGISITWRISEYVCVRISLVVFLYIPLRSSRVWATWEKHGSTVCIASNTVSWFHSITQRRRRRRRRSPPSANVDKWVNYILSHHNDTTFDEPEWCATLHGVPPLPQNKKVVV